MGYNEGLFLQYIYRVNSLAHFTPLCIGISRWHPTLAYSTTSLPTAAHTQSMKIVSTSSASTRWPHPHGQKWNIEFSEPDATNDIPFMQEYNSTYYPALTNLGRQFEATNIKDNNYPLLSATPMQFVNTAPGEQALVTLNVVLMGNNIRIQYTFSVPAGPFCDRYKCSSRSSNNPPTLRNLRTKHSF
jgi:hypothetical protein